MASPARLTALIFLWCASATAQDLYSSGHAHPSRQQPVKFRLADYVLPSDATYIETDATAGLLQSHNIAPPLDLPIVDPPATSRYVPATTEFPRELLPPLPLPEVPEEIPHTLVDPMHAWAPGGAPSGLATYAPHTSTSPALGSESFTVDTDHARADMDSVVAAIDPTPQGAIQDPECCLPRIWASAEYVLWFPKGANVPALITTSAPGTPQGQAARANLPSTSILFGQEEMSSGSRSGARFSLGGWLNQCNMLGVELNFLVLGNAESRITVGDENEILGRPFFNVLNTEQDAKLINFPGLAAGRIDAEIKSEFYTGEALMRKRTAGWGSSQLDWYLGYRTARLVDDIRIIEDATVLSGPATGAQLIQSDQFRTRNTFHGVDMGVRVGALMQPLFEVEMSGKVAVGTTRTETQIAGFSRTNVGGATTTSDFGFLAQPTNEGTTEDDTFSTVTEFGVSGKRMFRPGLSLRMGYTLFFWHDIIRAGDQIDTSINTSQFPPGVLINEPRPRIQNTQTNFWSHGFRIGFEYLF